MSRGHLKGISEMSMLPLRGLTLSGMYACITKLNVEFHTLGGRVTIRQ
jgi:hypothetical protein